MPGFDGTGPAGQGPMTGGGRGFCVLPNPTFGRYNFQYNPAYRFSTFRPLSRFANMWTGSAYLGARPFFVRGGRMGCGIGRGRGRGRW
ncbi:MAG: DUF5320 domain-containing protein [Armatimonadota bacterium]